MPAPTRRPPPRTARRATTPSVLPRLAAGAAVLYAVLLLAFWVLHYDGARPGGGQVLADFHAFLGLGPAEARAAPPKIEAPPPPKPAPVARPKRAPAPPKPRSALDRITDTLRRVEKEAPSIKALARGGPLERAQVDAVAQLTDARDELGAILDANPNDDRANGLWDRLQELLAALRKL